MNSKTMPTKPPLRRLQLTTQDRKTLVRLINNEVFARGLQNMIVACHGVNATASLLRNEGEGAIPFVSKTFYFRSHDEITPGNLEFEKLVNAVHTSAEWLTENFLPQYPEPVRKRWTAILVVLSFQGDATIKQDRSKTGRKEGRHPDTVKDLTNLAKHIEKTDMPPGEYIATYLVPKSRYYRAKNILKK